MQRCRFIDPEGNVFEIQMDEALLAEREFPAGFLLAKMYNLRLLYFITVRYVGGNLVHLRIFYWDWTEINYPIPKEQTQYPKLVRSIKFFTYFCVDFPLEPLNIYKLLIFTNFDLTKFCT